MAAGGDIVELVHEQTYLGQVCNNVYYFECAVADSSLTLLATWFEANVVPKVKACQIDLVTHTNLRLRNLFNLSETYEEPLTGTGSTASGAIELPSFFAAQIRFDHVNGAVRPGFKRYVGMGEGFVTDALMDGAIITSLTNLGNQLVNPLSPALPSFVHVIVNRVCEEPNPDPDAIPSCLKYRLPENFGESNPGYPVSAEVYAQPMTQNSRKWYT